MPAVSEQNVEAADELAGLLELITNSAILGSPQEAPAIIALSRMIRLVSRMRRQQTAAAKQLGLHVGDVDILFLLQRSVSTANLRITDLASALRVTAGGISKRIDRLEEAGLVRRAGTNGDRRAWLIVPTDEGLKLAQRARGLSKSTIIESLSTEEWQIFDQLLSRICQAHELIP